MREQYQSSDEIEIDLGEIFLLLRKKLLIIILCGILGGGAVAGTCKFLITPQYTATSMIYILSKTTSISSVVDIQLGAQLTVDFETLAISRPVLEDVMKRLNLKMSYVDLKRQITIENPPSTQILKMTVENKDPVLAKDISNTLSDATAQRVSEVMATDKPNIVERAVTPTVPSSPSTIRNTIIGTFASMLVAVVWFVLRFLMDDTIKTEEDVKKYLGLNILSAIPIEGEMKKNKKFRKKSKRRKKDKG